MQFDMGFKLDKPDCPAPREFNTGLILFMALQTQMLSIHNESCMQKQMYLITSIHLPLQLSSPMSSLFAHYYYCPFTKQDGNLLRNHAVIAPNSFFNSIFILIRWTNSLANLSIFTPDGREPLNFSTFKRNTNQKIKQFFTWNHPQYGMEKQA